MPSIARRPAGEGTSRRADGVKALLVGCPRRVRAVVDLDLAPAGLVLARVRGVEPVEGVVEVEADLAEAGAARDGGEVAREAACEGMG